MKFFNLYILLLKALAMLFSEHDWYWYDCIPVVGFPASGSKLKLSFTDGPNLVQKQLWGSRVQCSQRHVPEHYCTN